VQSKGSTVSKDDAQKHLFGTEVHAELIFEPTPEDSYAVLPDDYNKFLLQIRCGRVLAITYNIY